MSKNTKIGAAVIGVVIVLVATIGSHGSKATNKSSSSSASGGTAQITMVRGSGSNNSCTESDGEARIYIDITLRNTGDAAGTVNPWASFDYSDGGNSTESYDTNWGHNFMVPAHSTRDATFYHTFNPQQHSMIRCAGYADLSSDGNGYYLPAG